MSRRIRHALRFRSLGVGPEGARLERVRSSPNFRDGAFRNERPIDGLDVTDYIPLLRESLNREARARRRPARPVPLRRPDLTLPPVTGLRVTWMGHATVLVEIDGLRVLFDPVWGTRCSPVGFAGPRRLHPVPLPLGDLGPVDAVVISHDHYDHLDLPTIRALAGTRTRFCVPLGVGAHLEHWGVPADRIDELDWHESTRVKGVELTATPAQHCCGRGLRRHALSLWASWVVAGPDHRVHHTGDTGYFPGFARIGELYGPFDLSMIQIGAYSRLWPDIHMTPEEGVRAHRDLGGGVLLPIHWGTFDLAPHPWEEPVERTLTAAAEHGIPVALPRPGEVFEPGMPLGDLPADPWWRECVRAPVALGESSAPDGGRAGTATRGLRERAPDGPRNAVRVDAVRVDAVPVDAVPVDPGAGEPVAVDPGAGEVGNRRGPGAPTGTV
nr:MBL fold metallo-hydrolase [Streptomyces calidiresistens]